MHFQFPVIGIIHSCFKEKFGIPRQPGLVPLAQAQLELLSPYDDPCAVEGLESSSHIWVQFVFHANSRDTWKAKVKPPRLGGNKTMGVFATRSPIRPAPIGLSVVKLESIQRSDGKLFLNLSGVDFLDGTPVLDIKPYVPYVDSVMEATNHFAPAAPRFIAIRFSAATESFCAQYWREKNLNLIELIRQVLQQDPRPQYKIPDVEKTYGMKLLNLDVRWRYQFSGDQHEIVVENIIVIS